MLRSDKLNHVLSDFRFWIILFFLVRLIGITNPPLERAHNWRQTVVNMVSRNFLEVENNILYPRVDMAGELTGITGMEFPLMNYAIYLMSEVFGFEHWYGRLINLIISSFGMLFFFKLVEKYFNQKVALYSGLVLLFSIWFVYSRNVMPDTFSVSFVLGGLYFGMNYLDNKKSYLGWNLALYFLFMLLGGLSKIPSLFLLSMFIIPLVNRNIPFKRKSIFLFVSLLYLIPVIIWYFYWVPHLVHTFGFWHFFMGVSLIEGILEIIAGLPIVFSNFYEASLMYIGFLIFMFGLVMSFKNRMKLLGWILLLTAFSFLCIILKSGDNFIIHSYYMIPFAPVMALFAGYGLSLTNRRLAIILILLVGIENISNKWFQFKIDERELVFESLEEHMDQFSTKEDLFVVNSSVNPTPLYFAHRKGWIKNNDELSDEFGISELKNLNLKYILILKTAFGTDMFLELPIVFENEFYKVYRL